MPRRLRPLAVLLVLAPLAACAAASPRTDAAPQPAASADDGAARTTPPRIVEGGARTMRIQTTRVVPAGSPMMAEGPEISLSVDVDTTGRAMLETLSISGRDAAENREALREWMARARFAPATRGGVPVRGTFRWHAGR